MTKTLSIIAGVVLMTIALALFCTENMWCACIGTGCLLFSLLLIRWADSDKPSNK